MGAASTENRGYAPTVGLGSVCTACLGSVPAPLVLRRIADPEAVKPDDWDEDAPLEIEDTEAEKPEGWLDDEPDEIDDAGAHFALFMTLAAIGMFARWPCFP